MIESNERISNTERNLKTDEDRLISILSRIYSGFKEFEIMCELKVTKPEYRRIEGSFLQLHFQKISDIMNFSDLPQWKKLTQEMINWGYKIRDDKKLTLKYNRNYKIAPTIFYMYLRCRGIPVSSTRLIEKLHLDRSFFFQSIKDFYFHFPMYSMRNRMNLIKKHIKLVSQSFKFDSEFDDVAKQLLEFFFPKIMTKERVISALVCSLTLLYFDELKITYTKICNFLKVSPSVVIYHLKKNLIKERKFKGGLISAKRLIKKIINEKILNV